jgi:exonuclease SbcD
VNPENVRVLLLADTHLGFDLPRRPRVQRRRRGRDFFTNFETALKPALRGEVDLVVHGGDLFYRSKVHPALIEMALAPLVRVADRGLPVYIVPGNHERSRIPLHLWTAHPNIHIFDEPKTLLCPLGAGAVALSGFPFNRRVRDAFGELVQQTRHREIKADVRLLCIHQTVEGAQVGPSDFTFRRGPDVVKGGDIPGDFNAIVAGHIHRAQVLTRDLSARPLGAPVIYPGSVERTSFAERHEGKSYVILWVGLSGPYRGQLTEVSFVPLPARPMVDLVIEPEGLNGETLEAHLRTQLLALDREAIVRIILDGPAPRAIRERLSTAYVRALAPPSMNVSLAVQRRSAETAHPGQGQRPNDSD